LIHLPSLSQIKRMHVLSLAFSLIAIRRSGEITKRLEDAKA